MNEATAYRADPTAGAPRANGASRRGGVLRRFWARPFAMLDRPQRGVIWLAALALLMLGTQAATAQTVTTVTAPQGTNGIAIGTDGAIYTTRTDAADGHVYKGSIANGAYTSTAVLSGLIQASGLAIDTNGNLYVTDTASNNTLIKETLQPNGSYIASILATKAQLDNSVANGVAVDVAGNVYVAVSKVVFVGPDVNFTSALYKLTLSGGTYSTPVKISTTQLSRALNVTIDSAGNLYVADTSPNKIYKYTGTGNSYTETILSIPNNPSPVSASADPGGILYIPNTSSQQLIRAIPNGVNGYSTAVISPQLSNGKTAIDANRLTYVTDTNGSIRLVTPPPPPTVTSVAPTAGPTAGNTSIVLNGTGLVGTSAVMFGATPAAGFVNTSPVRITATAPPGTAGTVNITVTTPAGTSAAGPANQYTYVQAPVVSSLSPNAGPAAGSNVVVIIGVNLTGASAVLFGNTGASGVVVESDSQIRANAPAGAAGAIVNVRVVTRGGTSATGAGNQYTYLAAPVANAQSVTTAFNTPASITLTASNAPTSYTVATGATHGMLSGTAPNLTYTPTAGYSGADSFTFTATNATGTSAPATVSITVDPAVPASVGVRSGNNQSTTVDTAFAAPLEVTVRDANNATIANTPVTFTAPGAGAGVRFSNGTSTITVNTNGAGTAASGTITANEIAGSYSVVASADTQSANFTLNNRPAPTITSVSPAIGLAGDFVQITGTNLGSDSEPASSVTFGGIAASSVINATTNGSMLTVTVPGGNKPGPVAVVVTNSANGTVTRTNGYTYSATPTITQITPNQGSVAGGGQATITGTNFITDPDEFVYFRVGQNYAATTVVSATQATVMIPAGTATGVVSVQLFEGSGGARATLANAYSYYGQPSVVSLSPASGPAVGGNTVRITGSGFTLASAVQFGATPAMNFTVVDDTTIDAVAPPGNGVVGVSVTTPGGSDTLAASYTYPPAVAISPTTLPGGTVGTAYSQTLATTGGTAPYSYEVTSGTLPSGLSLSPSGTIAGTPDDEGSFDFTVTVTDSATPAVTASQAYTVAIAQMTGGATRTWVSGVGDDTNTCSRTAPCQTFAAAFARTATGGEINCLDAGGYGTLTITHSVSIICGDKAGRGGVLASGGTGITIDAPGASVVLNGLDLEGIGNSAGPIGVDGIRFVAGASLIVRDTMLRGFRGGYAIAFTPNADAQLALFNVNVADSGSTATADSGGVLVRPSGSGLTARFTVAGLRVANTQQSAVRLESASGSGNQLTAVIGRATLTGSTAAGLIVRGLGGAVQTTLINSTLTGGGYGVITNGATSVTTVADTVIAGNTTGLFAIGGGAIRSLGGNGVSGNGTDGTFTAQTPRQ